MPHCAPGGFYANTYKIVSLEDYLLKVMRRILSPSVGAYIIVRVLITVKVTKTMKAQ
jgi:hypothetical protein